ncbi:MAG: hypothetical protein ISS47_05415 [Candidatus Omnitrophica bacterium]|nr:hypothetical protein [Candidatus Omnitrophota bacterium]
MSHKNEELNNANLKRKSEKENKEYQKPQLKKYRILKRILGSSGASAG